MEIIAHWAYDAPFASIYVRNMVRGGLLGVPRFCAIGVEAEIIGKDSQTTSRTRPEERQKRGLPSLPSADETDPAVGGSFSAGQ